MTTISTRFAGGPTQRHEQVNGDDLALRWATFHGLVRLSLGAALIVHEGMIREQAQLDVIAAGLSLLVLPEAVRFDRWMARLRELAAAEVEDQDEPVP